MMLEYFYFLLPICILLQALHWLSIVVISNKHSLIQKTLILYCIFWSLLISFASYTFEGSTSLPFSVCPPGSLLTQISIPVGNHYLRRLIEPCLILWFFCQLYMVKVTDRPWTKTISIGFLTLLAAHFLDASILNIKAHLIETPSYLFIAPGMLWTLGLILFLFGSISASRLLQYQKRQIHRVPISAVCIFCGTLFLSGKYIVDFMKSPISFTGAHYYVWFPENWNAGISNHSPQQEEPRYHSDDSSVIRQHLQSMSDNNIKLLLLDWWPQKPTLKNRAQRVSEELTAFPEMQFAAHFETFDIVNNDSSQPILIESKKIKDVCLYFEHLAKRLFLNSQYLKIDQKPVVFWYVSRQMYGDVSLLITRVREHVLEKTGFEMYLVGDEVFPQVVRTQDSLAMLNTKMHPNWDRLAQFDAIYAYNPFDPTRSYPGTPEGNIESFLKYTRILYRNYSYISAASSKPFFPTLIPGYNDTVVRPKKQNAILERKTSGTLLIDDLMTLVQEELSYNTITLITSWNEWNEGTNLERDVESLRVISKDLQH